MPNTREKLIDAIEKEKPYIPTEDYEVGYNNGLTMAQTIILATDINVGHKWIPVTERLPDTAERVLVCRTWLGQVHKPEYGYYQDYPNQKGCWYVLTDYGYYPQREVTRWMPLPQPPKGE